MEKKIPKRMCIACREMREKKELIRIVYSKEGEISLDFTGKASGRGAYVCNSEVCIAKCCKTRALNRAFSREIDNSVYEKLKESYANRKN